MTTWFAAALVVLPGCASPAVDTDDVATTGSADTAEATDGAGDAAPVSLESVADGPKPGVQGWNLPPGTYTATVLGDRTTLTTADDLVLAEVSDQSLTITTSGAGDRVVALITRPVGLVPPDKVHTHTPHDVDLADYTIDVPEDLTEYFDGIEQVTVVDAGNGTGHDGLPFRWWDVRLPEQGGTFGCELAYGPECVGLVAVAGHVTEIEAPLTARFAQLDAQPGLVMWGQPQGPERTEDDEATAAGLVTALAEGLGGSGG